ncbi:MAG: mechanosensitive ion channel family protein [Alphaproteobacteria bacterium]
MSALSRTVTRCSGTLFSVLVGAFLIFTGTFASLAQPAANDAAGTGAPAIGQHAVESDSATQKTIAGILQTFRKFEHVTVDVQSGVVTLGGEVASAVDRREAEAVASQFGNINGIRNDIALSRELRDRGTAIYDRLQQRLNGLLVSIPLFIIAAAIFFIFLALSKFAYRRIQALNRLTTNPFQRQLLAQSIRGVIVIVGLILALEVLDATSLIGAVLGAAGITGIVLGFALKETIENYVAGLLLSLRQPFSPFDHIRVLAYEGHVIRLTSRATILMTLDGNHVRVPNAEVFKSAVVNFSRNPERRFEFDIGIGVDVDIVAARRLAQDTLRSMASVLRDPEPDTWVDALGDSNVVLKVVGWIDQREFSLPKVRGEAIRRVKGAFEAADFDLPEPIYRLKIMETGEIPAGRAAAAKAQPLSAADDSEVDLSRNTHVEREVAQERAEMPEGDLLTPDAPRE